MCGEAMALSGTAEVGTPVWGPMGLLPPPREPGPSGPADGAAAAAPTAAPKPTARPTASAARPQKPPVRPPLEYAAQVMSPKDFQQVAVPFEEAPQRLLQTMEKHGIAIVTGVLLEEEIASLEQDFKRDLMDVVDEARLAQAPDVVREAFARFEREGPRSFPLKSTLGYLSQSAGFCLQRCLPHGRFAWKIRVHPKVHAVFRLLFPEAEAQDLVTSLDATFFTPAGQPPAEVNPFSAHSDQNKYDARPGLADCNVYQGVVYIWPATSEGAESTTVVWPGSHRRIWPLMMRDPSFERNGASGFHYSEISQMVNGMDARALASGWSRNARRAVVPAGGLLLWNSRTVHCGWKGGPRLAQTVCLEPADRRPHSERLAKLRLAALGLPGCHWAQAAMQHDMSLGSWGVFSQDAVEAKAGSGEHDDVVLPLRGAMWPLALDGSADMDKLSELVDVEFRHTGMWTPTEGSEEVLEASVAEAFKRYL